MLNELLHNALRLESALSQSWLLQNKHIFNSETLPVICTPAVNVHLAFSNELETSLAHNAVIIGTMILLWCTQLSAHIPLTSQVIWWCYTLFQQHGKKRAEWAARTDFLRCCGIVRPLWAALLSTKSICKGGVIYFFSSFQCEKALFSTFKQSAHSETPASSRYSCHE